MLDCGDPHGIAQHAGILLETFPTRQYDVGVRIGCLGSHFHSDFGPRFRNDVRPQFFANLRVRE